MSSDVKAQPFLKWVGGKRQLLPELQRFYPEKVNRYFEPFVGGGAVFFDLRARGWKGTAMLGDANPYLITCYRAVRDECAVLIGWLRAHERNYLSSTEAQRLAYYKSVRSALGSSKAPDANEAARVIFLNRTCFNGLWRVNKKGGFNVPMGRYPKPTICDSDNLDACREALRGVTLNTEDFERSTAKAGRGDFVYFDSPYWPASASANFTGYTEGGFSSADQERLRDCARRLKRLGAHVILSNADVPPVRKLYASGFSIHRVEARRAINSKASKRGAVGEVIIT